jgi:malonate-semialdehyde dehydrogenase (acetylating) / methylmalonate-semialdehyde dehydrogenase
MVGADATISMPMAFHSFGGWKRSLFGDMAVHGPKACAFYTRLKIMSARLPTGIRTRRRIRRADVALEAR